MTTRAYLPMTASLLREALEAGRFGPAPVAAHAVTPTLAAQLPQADEEELEYAAMTAAAMDSIALLTDEDPPLRMVAALDVPGWNQSAGPHPEPTAVAVTTEVPWRRLAAVHVDSPVRPPTSRPPGPR